MRALLIGVVVAWVVGTATPAEARRGGVVVINTGDDITHVRDLSPEVAAQVGYSKLGYHYERFGLFWFDLWRWDGEFVIYEGSTYVSLDDDNLTLVGGGSVPWSYHLPDGLLITVAALYLAFIGRRKRSVKATLYITGVMLALALALFLMGLSWEFGIPLVIALHHGIAAWAATRARQDDDEVAAEPVRASQPMPRPRTVSTPPPIEDAVPSRPSHPLVVERPPPAVVVPMRADDSVDGPKLLR